MDDLFRAFHGRGAQKRVARFMFRKGVSVDESGSLLFSGVELKMSSLAGVLDVDRRVVKSTVETILSDGALYGVFSRLDSSVFLRDAAPLLGFGVFEVLPTDAASPGIIAGVTRVLDDAGVGLRQVVADDPMFENAGMTVITEEPIDKSLLDGLLGVDGVEKIVVLN